MYTGNKNLTGIFASIFEEYFTCLYRTHDWSSKNPDIDVMFNSRFSTTLGTPTDEFGNSSLTVAGVDGMGDVSLEILADKNYNIKATLYTGDADHKRNETVIEIKAEVKYTDEKSDVNYYYANGTDSAGNTIYGVGVRTTVVRNIAVTWTDTNATIKDGGAVS